MVRFSFFIYLFVFCFCRYLTGTTLRLDSANNVVIMQTEQLGRIEALEEELHSAKAKTEELSRKMEEQDRVIANLVGDNLDHLQDTCA